MKKYTRPMLYRMKTIHDMIKTGSFPNSKDFCSKLDQSRPTIMRDLDALRYDFEAPIVYDKKHNGYYYSNDDYNLPFNYLDKMSSEVLLYAKTLMQNFKDTPFYENLCDTISALIDPDCNGNSINLLERIAVAPTLIYQKTDEKIWNQILNAIKKNNMIEFDYTSKGNTNHITAEPYQIILDNGKTFLFANIIPENKMQLFAIFKLENLKVLDETFTLPKIYKFSQFTNNDRLGTFGAEIEKKQYKIKVSGNTQELLKTVKFTDDQNTEYDSKSNTTTYTFTSTQFEVIFNYLISFADEVLPLEPVELVEQWKLYWQDKTPKIIKKIELV